MIHLPSNIKRVLITGGSGFIGSALVRKLLMETNIKVYNLDKQSYASKFKCFQKFSNSKKYQMLNVDLFNELETKKAIQISNPDLVFHLAAESHVDNSIINPRIFLDSNINGTFNLLEALLLHWKSLSNERRKYFRLLHVSTDEVFGSADDGYFFTEKTRYNPRSPYSATKAASDHLVTSWTNTYGLPSIITNSSNNFGPWQFPEKFIPLIIRNCLSSQSVPVYGDGKNVRDWIYVDDHIDALIKVILKGKIGDNYCIGGGELKTNEEIVETVCNLLDFHKKENAPHIRFKKYIQDRPGHDKRYAIDNTKINDELKWTPKYDFYEGLNLTISWYIDNPKFLNQHFDI